MKKRWRSLMAAGVGFSLLFTGCGVLPVEDSGKAESSPQEQVSTPETEPEPLSAAELRLAEMTLHEKICQLFIVRPEALAVGKTVTSVDEDMKAALSAYPVGGVALFAQNIKQPEQCRKLLFDLQEASDVPLFAGVDEEGGIVSRVGANPDMGVARVPSMRQIGDAGDSAEALAVGNTIGSYLKPLGFNLDFAPVADVATNPNNTVIGSRAFSSDPETVARMVEAEVNGLHAAGVMAALKHFPGHGDTAEDSHTGMAISHQTLDGLRTCEFLPFASGIKAGAELVMVGHITVPNADDSGLPATMSHDLLTDVLRGELGFTGVIITDSLEMGAITEAYSQSEAAVRMLLAGVDILLMPSDLPAAVAGVEAAVSDGTLDEARVDQSVLRILRLKESYGLFEGA